MLFKARRLIPYSALALALMAFNTGAQEARLELRLGHSEILVQERAVEVVIVGNSEVADATLIADRSVLVTGRALGQTNLILADEAGREVFAATVDVVALDRRPTTRVRVVKGNTDEDRLYVCGPEPGCLPRAETNPATPPPVLRAEPSSGINLLPIEMDIESETDGVD